MSAQLLQLVGTFVAAVVASGLIQWFFNWRTRRAELDRTRADTERIRLETAEAVITAEETKRDLLAKAQLAAQHAALQSADARYDALHEDYAECRSGLREVRIAAFTLIDVVEMLLSRFTKNGDKYSGELSAKDVLDSRGAIATAREHLNR
jgi:chromosome condensin MukBEF ATPase and DNA-binding subunit MukB